MADVFAESILGREQPGIKFQIGVQASFNKDYAAAYLLGSQRCAVSAARPSSVVLCIPRRMNPFFVSLLSRSLD